ncbi:MAG TPA: CBS domain-containing protein, partial [Caldithrix abyssi]|nr:CBS domain-containing protein [Caldithrix abyssi]
HKRGICPVVDDEQHLLGVVTTGDLNRLLEVKKDFFDIPVSRVMNPTPKTCRADDLAVLAYQKMEKYKIIAMPVLEDGRLVGVVHLHDLMQQGIAR